MRGKRSVKDNAASVKGDRSEGNADWVKGDRSVNGDRSGKGRRSGLFKLRVHPLFWLTLLLCALFGGLTTALIALLTALLHECGHVFCAEKMGFTCRKITVMPYGASAVCELEGIRAGDEIKLALAGPAVNAAICVFTAGLWWFFPETYAFTDVVFYANLAMLVINLLPAYPLDGGRVAGCVLAKLFTKRVANIVLRVTAGAFSAVLFVFFFLSKYNPTLLAFSVFLACSALEKSQRAELVNFSSAGRLRRGMEVKYVLCDRSLTFKDAFKKLDDKKYLVLQLYAEGGVADEITQDELYEEACAHSFYDRVFDGESDEMLGVGAELNYFSRKERENKSSEGERESTLSIQLTPNLTASSTAPERE